MSYASAKSSVHVGGFYIEENCKNMVVPPEHAYKIEIALGEIGKNTISVYENTVEIDDNGRTTYDVAGKRIAKDKLRTVSARPIEQSRTTPAKTDKVK